MKEIEFWRISFNDSVYVADGTIRRFFDGLEIRTDNKAVNLFLTRCMKKETIISNPLVNVGKGFHFYAGNFKVTRANEECIVLSKFKSNKE